MKRYVPTNGYTSNCFICGQKLNLHELLDGQYMVGPDTFTDYDEDEVKEVDPRALELPYSQAVPVNKLPTTHPAIKFLHKDYLYDLDAYSNLHKIVFVPYEGGVIFSNSSVFITSAERLVFPVYFEQKMVGWQMRSLPGTFYGDMEKDVRYYHIFNKGDYLYNYDQAKSYQRVIVTEGVKKALKFPNGVATWGTGLSRKQLRLIQSWPEIVMLLDADQGKNNNTQTRAREFVDNINLGNNGVKKAINIDLSRYEADSPDDLPSNILQQIVEQEWNVQINQR